jgi:deoxycytidylate deaminase
MCRHRGTPPCDNQAMAGIEIEIEDRERAIEYAKRPELVFGLIGALGAEVGTVEGHLRDRMSRLGYEVPETVKLTVLLRELKGPAFENLGDRASISSKMDAGNELRTITKRGEAMAMLGVNRIRAYRGERGTGRGRGMKATAFIIDSLKHPTEVLALRKIYGSAFVAIAVFNERTERIRNTQARLAAQRGRGDLDEYKAEAEKLVQRDQDEQRNPYGQHVSEAFALADVVVGATDTRTLAESTDRFVEALFGNWTHTPTVDESSMFFAQGTRYRSASMARQVGAVIVRPDGSVAAAGTNDVPKAGGGLYDESDAPDGRDHARTQHKDSSDFYKREIVIDFLEHLLGLGPQGPFGRRRRAAGRRDVSDEGAEAREAARNDRLRPSRACRGGRDHGCSPARHRRTGGARSTRPHSRVTTAPSTSWRPESCA